MLSFGIKEPKRFVLKFMSRQRERCRANMLRGSILISDKNSVMS